MLARIADGQVAELRDLALTDIPEHKRGPWLDVEIVKPDYDPQTHTRNGPVDHVEADRVRRVWTVEPKPVSVADVKGEAQRRIIALTGTSDLIACMIKQSNANMRANKLNDKRLSGETLTAGEAAEAIGLRGMASAIEAIRDASNAIEASLPATMSALLTDARWP